MAIVLMVGMVDLVDLGTEGVKQMVTEVVEGAAIMEEEMEDILVAWLVPVQAVRRLFPDTAGAMLYLPLRPQTTSFIQVNLSIIPDCFSPIHP